MGGTWDLFRYPGIRTDSDMHTLGFSFAPWKHEKSIADGPSILEYLERHHRRISACANKMRFGQKVVSANWDSKTALLDRGDRGRRWQPQPASRGRFLFLGSGYYDYDDPYDAGFKGRTKFKGTMIHPQFWPKDFDYTGKKVVVIGSGATAVTIVPAMAHPGAAHVTQLQRTPTYMVSRPARDALANGLRKVLPEKVAYAITRFKNITLQDLMFKRVRDEPGKVKEFLLGETAKNLGPHYQRDRLCAALQPVGTAAVPGARRRFLRARSTQGKAEVVTDQIDSFDATGIKLEIGQAP